VSALAKVYSDGSTKPALVLVHGLGSAGSIWKSIISDLVKDFSVYAIDLPGHGEAPLNPDSKFDPKSLAHNVIEMMERDHGITELHVAGNSLGGWIALEMAAVAPDRVKSVTALAPAGLWQAGPTQKLPASLDARILAKISQFFMPLAYHLPPLKAIGYRKITHLWRELTYETCRDSVIAMAKSKGYKHLWQGLRGRKFDSHIPHHVEVAVVFGDNDKTLPEELAQDRSVLPKHAKWIVVENCAHVIMWNFPKLTVDFIRRTAGLATA
jgi:pimeloyl-ACP methyl ester carboxylesterase